MTQSSVLKYTDTITVVQSKYYCWSFSCHCSFRPVAWLIRFLQLKTALGPDVHFSVDGPSYQVISMIWSISADGTLNSTLPSERYLS